MKILLEDIAADPHGGRIRIGDGYWHYVGGDFPDGHDVSMLEEIRAVLEKHPSISTSILVASIMTYEGTEIFRRNIRREIILDTSISEQALYQAFLI